MVKELILIASGTLAKLGKVAKAPVGGFRLQSEEKGS